MLLGCVGLRFRWPMLTTLFRLDLVRAICATVKARHFHTDPEVGRCRMLAVQASAILEPLPSRHGNPWLTLWLAIADASAVHVSQDQRAAHPPQGQRHEQHEPQANHVEIPVSRQAGQVCHPSQTQGTVHGIPSMLHLSAHGVVWL